MIKEEIVLAVSYDLWGFSHALLNCYHDTVLSAIGQATILHSFKQTGFLCKELRGANEMKIHVQMVGKTIK